MKATLYLDRNTDAVQEWQQRVLLPFLKLLTIFFLLFAFSNAKVQAQCPSNIEYRRYGSATLDNITGDMILTPDAANQAGQAWSKKVIDLRQDFIQTFDIYLGTKESGGDGFAFVLRGMTSQTVGIGGQGLGYQGITPSLAFEFDTYYNSTAGDIANDHFALHKAGNPNATGRIGNNVDLVNIEDGAWHSVQIAWFAGSKRLSVYFDNTEIYNSVRDIVALDLDGNPNVILGFTASTGSVFNDQRVCINQLLYTPYTSCPYNDEFKLTGQATFQNGSILLTADAANQAGQAWSKKTIDLTKPFTQTFDINLGTDDGGADGFAFVLRGNTAQTAGTVGQGLGYGGISPSVAFEFDTYYNVGPDIVNDHFALHVGGNATSALGRIGSAVSLGTGGNIEDGKVHEAIIDWNPTTKTITVSFDGAVVYTTVRDIVALDFAGNPYVTIGFTASTGLLFNPQLVCIKDLIYTPCNAGLVAPVLSATTASPACPIKTANLNALVTSTIPDATSLAWFTNAAHTGTAISTPTAAGPGTYYGFYYGSAGTGCYSPATAAVTVSSTSAICSDLSLTAVPNLSNKNKGETITYTCTLSNAGPDAAPNTNVQVRIPNNTTLLTAVPSQGTFVQGNNVWEAGTVANGANLTITVTVIVN